jgi:hypothetical protein
MPAAAPRPPYHASTRAADRAAHTVMVALDGLPVGDRLLALRSIAGLVGSRRAGTVLAARNAGMSWAEIADRLGMSRQAVWHRYGPEEVDVPPPGRAGAPHARGPAHAGRPPRTYSSCASYKAVTTRPAMEPAP